MLSYNRKCPNCQNNLFKDEICPFCGWGRYSFSDETEYTAYTKKLKKHERNESEYKLTCIREIIDFEDRRLTLYNGKLYGIGDNSRGQISSDAVSGYDTHQLIAENVVKAVAAKDYTLYITEEGSLKIVGNGKLADKFPGFCGAIDIFTTEDGQFVVASEDGFFYGFGNNEEGKLEKIQKTEIFRKENNPFKAGYDPYFTHGYAVREKDEKGHLHSRHWTHDDTVNYWRTNYFSNPCFCGDDVFGRYLECLSENGSENVTWDVDLDIEEGQPYRTEDTYYQEFTGTARVVIYSKNNYIFAPVRLEKEKVTELLASKQNFFTTKREFTDITSEMKLFANSTEISIILILNKGKLYCHGRNLLGHFGSDVPDEYYRNPALIAENVISAAVSSEYTIYVTADGEVKLLGNGEYVDRFPKFTNAKQVFATEDNKFYIVSRDNVVYAFGNNEDYGLQDKKETLIFSDYEFCQVGDLYPSTIFNPARGNVDYKSLTNIANKKLEDYNKKYGTRNLSNRTYLDNPVTTGNVPYTQSANIDYALYLTNKHIYKPIIITGKRLENFKTTIEFHPGSCDIHYDVKKLVVKEKTDKDGYTSIKKGVALLTDGRVMVWSLNSKKWKFTKCKIEDACDVEIFDCKYDKSDFDVDVIISQRNKKVLVRKISELLKYNELFNLGLRIVFDHKITEEYNNDFFLPD